jgi:Sugar (and other) transporter.
LPRDLVVAWR